MQKGSQVKMRGNILPGFGTPPRRTDTGTIINITNDIVDVKWSNGDITVELKSQLEPA